MKKIIFSIPLFINLLVAFEESPWVDFPYEFHFKSAWKESYYSKIANSYNQTSKYKNSVNEQLNLALSVSTISLLDVQLESEFFQTKATNFTLESLGVQVRKQLFDDIQGDLVSLTLGGLFRFVPDQALKDPYVPYQNLVNFEANFSLGKEFDEAFEWTKRFYTFFSCGIANIGSPYIRSKTVFEIHKGHHLFGWILDGNFGLEGKRSVNLENFHGYGSVRHQTLDIGVTYDYLFDIYGKVSAAFFYRLYAFAAPKNQAAIEFKYDLPFSIF